MARKRRDPDIPKIRKAFKQILPNADITIRDVPYGDWLHVYIHDDVFKGLLPDERDEMVWPRLFELLSPEVRLRITQCHLMARDEDPLSALVGRSKRRTHQQGGKSDGN